MALETATFLSQLVTSNPTGSDFQSQGDDHLRLLKSVLQATFPNADRAFRFPTGIAAIVTTPVTLAATDSNEITPVDATAVARVVNLPTTSLVDGISFLITKVDSSVNTVTVATAALINGAANVVLRFQWDTIKVWYNLATTTWYAELISPRFGVPRIVTGAAATLAVTDFMGRVEIDPTSANRIVTLPSTLPTGFRCTVQKIDSDTTKLVTLTAAANINGAGTLVLREQWEEVDIWWNGTTWRTWDLGTRIRALDTLIAANYDTIAIQAFTGSGTYTPTAGMKHCIVIGTGAGGGGGGADGTNPGANAAGGGGAGGTVITFLTAAQIGVSKTVTIGPAGTAGAATGATGGTGGSTTLSGSLLTALGGIGGVGTNGGGPEVGGLGGVPVGFLINITGGDGHTGVGSTIGGGSGDGRGTMGGHGGASLWGGGARGPVGISGAVSTAGTDGKTYGAGGSGAIALNSATGVAGGADAAGFMMIVDFL